MATGIFAHDRGGKALLLEKTHLYGGSSAMSGGSLWIPNNYLMAAAGVRDTPEEALTATTVNNARVLREADQVGRLAPGMLADFIVVDGDPVADVGVLLKPGAVEAVYLGGRRVELALPTGMRRYPWERGHRQWGEIYDRDRVAHLRATGAQGPLPRRES